MQRTITPLLTYYETHKDNIIFAFFLWFVTYFSEISGNIHVMAAAFAMDLFFGIWRNVWKEKKTFSSHKFFNQFQRFAIVLIVVLLLFAMDKENGQEVANIYAGVTWLVTGYLIYSIADNGFAITGWDLFKFIKTFVQKKIEEKTEVNIEEKIETK